MSDVAASRSPDPAVRALARSIATSEGSRSRTEMVEGLDGQVRGFAEHAITENSAGLHRIPDLSPA